MERSFRRMPASDVMDYAGQLRDSGKTGTEFRKLLTRKIQALVPPARLNLPQEFRYAVGLHRWPVVRVRLSHICHRRSLSDRAGSSPDGRES